MGHSHSSRTSTSRLPAKVWQRIAFYLGSEGGSISLLNSALREPGQRGLFQHLKFTGAAFSAKVTKKQKKGWTERIARFRKLGKSATIRSYITSVELVDWTSGHPEPLVRPTLATPSRVC
jgi:hypothetical protein